MSPCRRVFPVVVGACVGFVVAGAVLARSAAALPALVATSAPSATAKDALDRQTPRRTIEGFIKEGREGDFRVAASYLDLRGIADARRATDGPDLAQKLAYVLERQPTLDIEKIPDVPDGDATSKATGTYVAETLYAGEDPVPIALSRAHFPDGVDRWLIARATVDRIPMLDATYGPRPIGIPIPASLTGPMFLGNELWQWLGVLIAVVVAYAIARGLSAVIVRTASYFTQRTPTHEDDELVESARRPLRMVAGALVFRLLLDPLQLTTAVVGVCEHATFTALVIGIAWLLLRALGVATLWLDEQAGRDGVDVIRGRRVRTQAMLLRRVASVSIAFISAACLLIQFEFVRNVGVSLLASAGVVSVVVGLAAQKSLAAIIAGIQFSVAQPVRMGDQIVAEGEFGEIEEINLTYAVVRLWDKRRLILPINYFLEKPFQNWTRTETDLIGAVLLHVDYTLSVDAMRTELKRICESTPLWDKQTCALQVTDSDATSATLRALVSAQSAGALWDLRCTVREQLLAFLQSYDGGRFLPRQRQAVLASPPALGLATVSGAK